MIQAVIFDMDGVIVDTEPLHDKAGAAVLRKYSISVKKGFGEQFRGCTEEFVWSSIGKMFGINDYKKLMKEKGGLYLNLIRKHLDTVPGCIGLIKKLKPKYKISLASSSPMMEINTILSSLGIEKYFDVIVSGEFVKRSKPEPDIYLEAAKKLGAKPSECLVFEDAVNGVKAAKAAGMKCIAITTSFGKKDLKEADLIIDSFEGFDIGLIGEI